MGECWASPTPSSQLQVVHILRRGCHPTYAQILQLLKSNCTASQKLYRGNRVQGLLPIRGLNFHMHVKIASHSLRYIFYFVYRRRGIATWLRDSVLCHNRLSSLIFDQLSTRQPRTRRSYRQFGILKLFQGKWDAAKSVSRRSTPALILTSSAGARFTHVFARGALNC